MPTPTQANRWLEWATRPAHPIFRQEQGSGVWAKRELPQTPFFSPSSERPPRDRVDYLRVADNPETAAATPRSVGGIHQSWVTLQITAAYNFLDSPPATRIMSALSRRASKEHRKPPQEGPYDTQIHCKTLVRCCNVPGDRLRRNVDQNASRQRG